MKLRGMKRRQKIIDQWKNSNLNLDLINGSSRGYCKILIDPWYRLEKQNPPADYRNQIFKGLIEIYQSWKKQLDELGESYYLKIWLYEKKFISSQVVYARGEEKDFYLNTFNENNDGKTFKPEKYKSDIRSLLNKFTWERKADCSSCLVESDYAEDLYEAEEEWQNDLKFFNKAKKNAEYSKELYGDIYYFLKVDNIWIGEINS